MNIDLEAIKRAAETALAEDAKKQSDWPVWDAAYEEFHHRADPATVLELVRLARERQAMLQPCEWVQEGADTSIWLTGCGEEFWFDESPEGIIYCAHCGHPAKIKEPPHDE